MKSSQPLAALILTTSLVAFTDNASAAETSRPSLRFENARARLIVDLNGGAIGNFQFKDQGLNPLNWGTPAPGDESVRGFGHFLCLDRWGPPSDAEGARGMPYHGEASSVAWSMSTPVQQANEASQGGMIARLPKAGMAVRRTIRFSQTEALFSVTEEITNENALGRVYNCVQHPTVGPPFLDASTVVDCNGRRGFAQGGRLPTPEEPSSYWPAALNADGRSINLRHLTDDPNPNVTSFLIDSDLGWVTATTASRGLLIGYLWNTADYPWVSLWRDVRDGRPAARGLEFGTTGLHQPFPILTKKGRIWDRQIFEFLDAGETTAKSYAAFLLKVPADFQGVDTLQIAGSRLIIRERTNGRAREFSVDGTGILPLQRHPDKP